MTFSYIAIPTSVMLAKYHDALKTLISRENEINLVREGILAELHAKKDKLLAKQAQISLQKSSIWAQAQNYMQLSKKSWFTRSKYLKLFHETMDEYHKLPSNSCGFNIMRVELDIKYLPNVSERIAEIQSAVSKLEIAKKHNVESILLAEDELTEFENISNAAQDLLNTLKEQYEIAITE